jgi:murein DD-endopeptidase MepM/ murein hydrolase activator NlpD
MKQISRLLVVFGLAFILVLVNPNSLLAQKLSNVPVDLEIPVAPTPVKADGKIHLLYELHITNFRSKNLELMRIEVFKDSANIQTLARYEGVELTGLIYRPGAEANLPNVRVIGGGMRAIIFLQITFSTLDEVPVALHHRIFFKSDDPNGEERSVDAARVVIQRKKPLIVGPPVRGEGWLALSAFSNTNSHRRTLVVVDGKARIAQRFATDWTRIGSDGLAFRGDPAKNANWSPYGAEVIAVANATVVDVKDGIPENDPTADTKAVKITLENVAGNYIILDLGHGYFALYAHLQPNSMRIKVGDKVRRGQVLALLGNSGQADAPHLHFHIIDGNSPLGAEGMPYVIDSFEMEGILSSKQLIIEGGWKRPMSSTKDKRQKEIPIENAIVRFP